MRGSIPPDRNDGPGDFVELEVVLSDEQSVDDGLATARRLMSELGIPENQLIDKAYIDLLPDGRSA